MTESDYFVWIKFVRICRRFDPATWRTSGEHLATVLPRRSYWPNRYLNVRHVPIGCQHFCSVWRRSMSGKVSMGYPLKMRASHGLWSAGRLPPDWRSPQPEGRAPIAPLKSTTGTQDNRLSPHSSLHPDSYISGISQSSRILSTVFKG